MDSSKDRAPSITSLSSTKSKRQTKGPTLKPQGIIKPSSASKASLTGALHRFAADPKRKNVGVGFRALGDPENPVSRSANPAPTFVNQQFSFQQIETPVTLSQSYASTLHALPSSTTSPSAFSMTSATPTPSSQSLTNSPSLVQPPSSRKRSADAPKASEPKRQKTDPFKIYDPFPSTRKCLPAPAISPNTMRASFDFRSSWVANSQAIHSHGQNISKLDNNPSTTVSRGYNIASLLNHQQDVQQNGQYCSELTDSSATPARGDHARILSSYSQATLPTSTSHEGVATFTSPVQDTLASSLNGSTKKHKYDTTEETGAERSPKRAKIEATPAEPARTSKGGRPKGPPKPTRVRTSLPTLTSKTPVGHFPIDLWGTVFEFSAPGFLLKAQGVCSLFNLSLQYTKIWESARKATYPDCPSPPAGMTEKEYAFHLDGDGCQAMANGAKCPDKCRRTYWAFQKKWCVNHLKERLMSARELQDLETNYPDLRHLVPSAGFDSWNTYLCAGRYTAKPTWLRCLPYKTFYLRADVKDLTREYDDIRVTRTDGTTPSPDDVQAWVNEKRAEVARKVKERQDIEAWVETKRLAELTEHQNLSQAKKDFYKANALAMNPPLEFAALELTRSYQNAIAIKKAPCKRSWQILEKKLESERRYAEEIVRLDCETLRQGIPPDDRQGFGPYGVRDDMTKQGRLVATIAQDLIDEAASKIPDVTATDEWVPRILNGFYQAFEALDDSLKRDEDGSVISLTLYHAKFVAQQIEAHFHIARGNPVPQYLTVKCPLCPHKGASTTRSFERHVSHIGKKHARSTPGFAEWRMFDNRAFPWMRVPWPRNLPMLRKRETSTGQWDLGA